MIKAPKRLRAVGLAIWIFAASACSATGSIERNAPSQSVESGIPEILRSQHQQEVNRIAEAVLMRQITLDRSWLLDNTPADISFSVRDVSIVEGVTHLGVRSVSQFFLCLLELRERTTSKEILEAVAPELTGQLSRINCGACCAQVFELPKNVESTLRDTAVQDNPRLRPEPPETGA